MTQSVDEQIGAIAAIEAELHLREIGREMLGADLVPRAYDAALQKRKRGFDCVSRDTLAVFVAGIFLGVVIDRLMSVLTNGGLIGGEFVSDNHIHVGADIFLDVLRQRSLACIFGMEETNVTAALTNADDYLLGMPFAAPTGTVTSRLSADVGFVHFDSTIQHRSLGFIHGSADAMTEIPRGFVGAFVESPDRALELVGAHAFLRFAEKQGRHKPDRQRQVGVIEDRPSQHGELINAGLTKEKFFRSRQFDSIGLAAGAANTLGPTEPLEQFAALFVGREHLGNV